MLNVTYLVRLLVLLLRIEPMMRFVTDGRQPSQLMPANFLLHKKCSSRWGSSGLRLGPLLTAK